MLKERIVIVKKLIEECIELLELNICSVIQSEQKANPETVHQWAFPVYPGFTLYILIIEEFDDYFIRLEVVVSEQKFWSEEFVRYALMTQYCYLYPYRLTLKNNFLIILYQSPLGDICDEDLRKIISNIIPFSVSAFNELEEKFKIKPCLK